MQQDYKDNKFIIFDTERIIINLKSISKFAVSDPKYLPRRLA